MIKSVSEYKAFIEGLRSDMIAIWENVPARDRGDRANTIAAQLTLSQTTVTNYFKGLISDPETALTILEKYNEIYN